MENEISSKALAEFYLFFTKYELSLLDSLILSEEWVVIRYYSIINP